ncbi:NHLP leader peptide family RiPP precursor [Paenibacillus sp. PR3]|uniref:NHLP leader peptide family RiPP n=1 Tax=Paenibacillus terricola TaxID=2763503 RepID=A0ABR8N3T3_9BACL|nr:NHLP leader peptide family RiPP precursor [Paenibacillus terricola]MBD3921921.1 NHLP leader peptide family RiPP precursor [Paenibacillus terricola]
MSISVDALKVQIIKKAWEDEQFKQELLADPKAAILKAFQVEIPAAINLKVVEEEAASYYLVLPPKPEAVLTKAAEVGAQPFIWV